MAEIKVDRPSHTRWLPLVAAAGLAAIALSFWANDRPTGPQAYNAEVPQVSTAFNYMGERWVPDPNGRVTVRQDGEMVRIGGLEGRQIYGEAGGGGGMGAVTNRGRLYMRVGENRYFPMVQRD